jgi:PKHD-type hydroxylase
MIFELDLLEHEHIQSIHQYLNKISYLPGKLSTGENKNVKITEIVDQKHFNYRKIYDIISNAVSYNHTFSSLLAVKKITPPMIAKYNQGSFYDWHVDELQICDTITHYSMSVFLNDPDEYGGGELVLVREGKEESYKLSAGKALVYSTGMLHKVNEVTGGNRIVAISWIESLIRDEFIRNCVFEMGKIVADNDDIDKKLLMFEQIRINMMRQYGNF